jgi:hypothetical protein
MDFNLKIIPFFYSHGYEYLSRDPNMNTFCEQQPFWYARIFMKIGFQHLKSICFGSTNDMVVIRQKVNIGGWSTIEYPDSTSPNQ